MIMRMNTRKNIIHLWRLKKKKKIFNHPLAEWKKDERRGCMSMKRGRGNQQMSSGENCEKETRKKKNNMKEKERGKKKGN